jgi:hypothetical protein
MENDDDDGVIYFSECMQCPFIEGLQCLSGSFHCIAFLGLQQTTDN